MTAEYLVRVLMALDRLTEVAVGVEDRLTMRLIGRRASGEADAENAGRGGGPLRELGRATRRSVARLWSRAGEIRRMIVLLPKLAAQHRMLARLQSGPQVSAVVVGIASNRLILNERAATARDALSALFARVGGVADPGISEAIHRADHVLLFDALPVSRLWRQRDKFSDDRVFIVDGAFVLFEMAAASLKGQAAALWRAARRATAALRRLPNGRPLSRRRVMLIAAIAEINGRILSRWTSIDAYFLTCNSVLTEVLRAQLIASPSCRGVVDVMHGVGSIPAEELFAEVLEAGRPYGAFEKHHFIPQIPGLPLAGVFRSQTNGDAARAINAYLNMYFLRFENEGRDPAAMLEAEYEALRLRRADGTDPVIITVLGFAPHSGRLIGSAAFEIECALLSLIGETREATGANWRIVYAPHPIHANLSLDVPLFQRYDVTVYRNSVFTWLISDACLSLMSSAMFEAACFGVHAFTPTIPSDRIFTADYLELVSFPAGDSLDDCREALRAFLTTCDRPSDIDVLSRARRRLALMRRPQLPGQDDHSRSGANEQDWVGQGHRVFVG